MNPAAAQKHIRQLFGECLGAKCWRVTVGNGTLPQFTLALGRRIRQKYPAHLKQWVQKRGLKLPVHQGEISIYVRCWWRLERGGRILCGSDDQENAICESLESLAGQSLTRIRFKKPAWDLELEFSDGVRLMVFSSYTSKEDSLMRNWHIHTKTAKIYAGPGEAIQIELNSTG